MTLTPRLNRYLAGLASLVLICGLTACTKTVDGSARYSGARPSSDQPLVKITQLPELLAAAGEVGEVMGVPGFVAALISVAALVFDWGIVGVWAALFVLICVRLVLMGWRFAGRQWLVTGWA